MVLVGLTKHSPTIFHVLVTDVLGDFLNIFVFSMLQQLTEIRLYVFHTPSVTFLGYVLEDLEGVEQHFILWTNHRNLCAEHQRQNSGMLVSALWLFNCSVSYHPGSMNIKPDAPLHEFSPDRDDLKPESVLACSYTVGRIILGDCAGSLSQAFFLLMKRRSFSLWCIDSPNQDISSFFL